VRHHLSRPAATAVGVAAVLTYCCGPGAAVARAHANPAAGSATSGSAVARSASRVSHARAGADTAGPPNCVTLISFGPRATADGGFRALSRGARGDEPPGARSPGQAMPRRPGQAATAWLRQAPAGTAPAASRPAGPTRTVTVTGTTIAGRPASGRYDQVFLFNADDSARFDNPGTSIKSFVHGVAKFRVPAGHYWAVGDFTRPLPRQQSWDEYLDVLPQFPVSGNTTVHLAAGAATSRIAAAVGRPVTAQSATFQLIRFAAAGPPVSLGWLVNNGGPKIPVPSLYISPTSARPTVGKLATVTTEQLGSGVFPSGSRYLYDLAYQSSGTIPSQRHVVNQAALATVRLRYYSAPRSAGVSGTFPAFPVSQACPFGAALFGDMHFPARQNVYLSTARALSWQTQFIQNAARDYSGGQVGPVQAFVPGEQQTQNFGAYPLHPAPNVRLSDVAGSPPVQVSAGRTGNTLRLAMTAFSDSTPGHVGQGTFPPVKTAASYEIQQNGTRLAGGAVPRFTGAFAATAALSAAPSTIRVSLSAAESAKLNPLSTASRTVWTWRSARAPRDRLPAGWTCQPGAAAGRACAVQPLLTLRYGVVGLGLDGSAAPGQQVVRVLAGHLQLARAAKVNRAAVSVSFDGGKTWRPARMTGAGGSYAAVFRAPAGARVTLRTTASDAAGGAITETITNAYRVAS
jgi:hypothetical protein